MVNNNKNGHYCAYPVYKNRFQVTPSSSLIVFEHLINTSKGSCFAAKVQSYWKETRGQKFFFVGRALNFQAHCT